ncbi:uncharacterized protein LOC135469038 [Liolophura sinensis]|uniref:uncharacterized protein LOC135469038 n=1 Tax=Liolophura sinensis TaxID=3198878 RepID=UPI0031592044
MERTRLIRRESTGMSGSEHGRATEGETTGLLKVPTSNNREKPLPSHLLFSVVSILTCPPLGILAVREALKVEKAGRSNDLDCAKRASSRAAMYSLASVMIGVHLACLVGTCVICYLYQHH